MTTIYCQVTLEGLDGSVQVEPFTINDTAANYATFLSTNNNFAVAKTDSYITDILVGATPSTATKIKLFVNGRDTGIAYLLKGLLSTINNRMPSKPGIGEGASMQLVQA